VQSNCASSKNKTPHSRMRGFVFLCSEFDDGSTDGSFFDQWFVSYFSVAKQICELSGNIAKRCLNVMAKISTALSQNQKHSVT
jgi:hypothetical protein